LKTGRFRQVQTRFMYSRPKQTLQWDMSIRVGQGTNQGMTRRLFANPPAQVIGLLDHGLQWRSKIMENKINSLVLKAGAISQLTLAFSLLS
jgi:hypothetical protein